MNMNSLPGKCLSVVIPCYNEGETIFQILEEVLAQDSVGEVILVDDYSKDNCVEIISSFTDSRITLLKNSQNLGKGASVALGIKSATKTYLVIQDADLEYSPADYSKLLVLLISDQADVAYGSRFINSQGQETDRAWHKFGNFFLTKASNLFTGLDLTDMETCYKMIKLDFAKKLNIQEKRFGIEPEITAKLARMGARIVEVPISYTARPYSQGKKITWRDGFAALYCIIKYRFARL